MSPNKSNTIILPSGETSSDIHVPSSVVNLSGRVGTSGSSLFGAVRRVVSAGVWANVAPAVLSRTANARTDRADEARRGMDGSRTVRFLTYRVGGGLARSNVGG